MGQLVSNSDYQDVLGSTQKVRVLLIIDSPSTVYLDAKKHGNLEVNMPISVDCSYGHHTFTFESTECNDVRANIDVELSPLDEGKTITVSLKKEVKKYIKKHRKGLFRWLMESPGVFWAYMFLCLLIFIVSIIAIIVGWFNDQGHAPIWTWLFWESIIIGVLSFIGGLCASFNKDKK